MKPDTGKRVHVERTGTVDMAISTRDAFQLFNAKGERRWVAGWVPHFVHPIKPSAGEGVVFQTTKEGAGVATWVQTRHKPSEGIASFVYVIPDHHTAMVDMVVTPESMERIRAVVKYRMTSLSFNADGFVRSFDNDFEYFMADWADAIRKHIVEGIPLAVS